MAVKRCGCGRCYSVAEWLVLPSIGRRRDSYGDGGPDTDLDYRNCPCGSTIAVDLCDPQYAAYRSALQEVA